MVENRSGNIFQFPLHANLGFGFCELVDYSDIDSFNGKLLFVFDYFKQLKDESIPSIEQIKKESFLFGPVPLATYPSVKGKKAWHIVGKDPSPISKVPIFKNVQANYNVKDWTKIGPWYKLYNFNERSEHFSYDQVRELELPILYTQEKIEVRATMHYLIKSGSDINQYFDLDIFNIGHTLATILNTNLSKEVADALLEKYPFKWSKT
jgi:hypothetical protein